VELAPFPEAESLEIEVLSVAEEGAADDGDRAGQAG
jgi:hypothetical protein